MLNDTQTTTTDEINVTQAAIDSPETEQAANSPPVPNDHSADLRSAPENDALTDKQPAPNGTNQQEPKPNAASDDDDITVKYTAPQSESEALKVANEKIEKLESQMYMREKNVGKQYEEDVFILAKARAGSEKTMQEAIDEVLKRNPAFIVLPPRIIVSPTIPIGNDDPPERTDDFENGVRGISSFSPMVRFS
ncbi:hypothetical protein [Ruminococcus sp.]|uniref:hypothetical protein n=1 Tax=Ruminococcus sp. TaxID=41978 RepID=UPI0025F2367F|nr:hypothetical protein [Ruminococcus sp.]MBR1430178.1 hypothetical protein [Ruminococcus sp.]